MPDIALGIGAGQSIVSNNRDFGGALDAIEIGGRCRGAAGRDSRAAGGIDRLDIDPIADAGVIFGGDVGDRGVFLRQIVPGELFRQRVGSASCLSRLWDRARCKPHRRYRYPDPRHNCANHG